MTVLEPKADRDNRGIDTFERASVYSMLLLYKSVKQDPVRDIYQNDTVTYSIVDSKQPVTEINIQVLLPYDRVSSTNSGANFYKSLLKLSLSNPNPIDVICSASNFNRFASLFEEIMAVDTLEKYCLWVHQLLKSNLVQNDPDNADKVRIQFFNENQDFPRIRIQARIPLNQRRYHRNGNLICSVEPLAISPVDFLGESTTAAMENTTTMNNDLTMDNGGGSSSTMNNATTMNNDTTMNNG